MCGDFKGHDPESITEILVHQSVLRCERILVIVAETSIVDVRPLRGGTTQKLKICNFVDIHLIFVSHY